MSIPYVITALAIIAVVTFVLRAAPFVALSKVADHPIVVEVGRSMPIGVMVILVLYTLLDVSFADLAGWAPAFAGMVVTFLVHLKWKNAMPSIVSGVATYAVLLHVLA
ncbi:MAG TPA: AzlD domain-containing protein [Actinomyces sp.]|jgi:branched-subunit amino acid transport protein AzlD|nr:AzlD domain-containing protein [Acidobacteriota bacterium]HHT41695.1 AzlD domain-containing protein [Actinomyces sp.]